MTAARAAHVDGRVLNSAILAPGMLAPLILRLLGTASARRLFASSLLVAAFTPALAGAFGLDGERALWMRLEDVVAVLIVFAPMAAAAAIVAGPDRETPARRAVTAVSLGGGIATAALLLARWPQGQPLPLGLAMAPFHVALFGVLFAVTLLPLLLLARAFSSRPVLLALAGLVCSPAPLIAGAYIDHRTVTECLDALRRAPLSFAAWSLPFVIGAIAVGWRLPPCAVPRNSSFASLVVSVPGIASPADSQERPMPARGLNWPLWSGFLLSPIAFLSYPFLFERWPMTRDFPWVNLLLFGLTALLLAIGLRRAFAPGRRRWLRITSGLIVTSLSVAIVANFALSVFVHARHLPASAHAPGVGERAPGFTLPDESGAPVSLAALLARAPVTGEPASKGVLLVFSMYAGCRACNSEYPRNSAAPR